MACPGRYGKAYVAYEPPSGVRRKAGAGAVPLATPKSKLRALIGPGGPSRPQGCRAGRGRRRWGRPLPTPLRLRQRTARTR
eukprot:10460686-Alexandrium_andersonii.AAC.1